MSDRNAMIWIVDDDRSVRIVLAAALREAGFASREFADAEAASVALADEVPALMFTDLRMPGANGLKLVERAAAHVPGFPVIVMSAYTDVASTAAAYRQGAFDYLPKPFDLDEAVGAARRALASARSPQTTPARSVDNETDVELIGSSAAMRELFRAIGRVAASGLGVLVCGETGTGKELVARALHRESTRSPRAFVALNTAAVPAELLESELFGHEAGAFTGAVRRHAGRFEQADGGTLFLDEIGDMPLALQTRLLRVLAAGEFYRVGGRELIRADARIIAATHQDLDAKVELGEFRADLLHRLDVARLELPSLRNRRDDIAPMAQHFLARAAAAAGVPAKRFTAAALDCLRGYSWPGNVRQLENLCRRVAVLVPGREIGIGELPPAIASAVVPAAMGDWAAGLRRWAESALAADAADIHAKALAECERVLFDVALTAHDGHRQHAARALGVSRNTLTRKLGSSRKRRAGSDDAGNGDG